MPNEKEFFIVYELIKFFQEIDSLYWRLMRIVPKDISVTHYSMMYENKAKFHIRLY